MQFWTRFRVEPWAFLQLAHATCALRPMIRATFAPSVLPQLLARVWCLLKGYRQAWLFTGFFFALLVLYDPRAFIAHAWLHQAFAHCIIFATTVGSGPCLSSGVADHPLNQLHVFLSEPLPRNKLMGRELSLSNLAVFPTRTSSRSRIRYCGGFPPFSQTRGCYPRVTHPCATVHPPKRALVRLACVRPAASVRSEPGSNSPV